ncbi:putative cinnamoyl-CoA reductase [Whalleya microplaca]|nr:putative cinnamoyl-CoA reductase [Whalleya microplaca]
MVTTILITGATGLVGFRILLAALGAGLNVRYPVRSKEEAQISSVLGPSSAETHTRDRLSAVVTPNFTAYGAFDFASQGVSSTFNNVFEACVLAKMVEMRNTEKVVKTHGLHFIISYVVPGDAFSRNELALDSAMMQTQNSSNNFLKVGMLGRELPFSFHRVLTHLDDVAEARLRVAFLKPKAGGGGKDVGIATTVDFRTIFDHVEK